MIATIMKYLKEIIYSAIILVLLAVGIGLFVIISDGADSIKAESTMKVSGVSQMKFNTYDGTTRLGSEVLNAVTEFKATPQFSIYIKTGANPTGFHMKTFDGQYYAVPGAGGVVTAGTTTNIATEADLKNQKVEKFYINKMALFDAEIYKDAGDQTRLIVFSQK